MLINNKFRYLRYGLVISGYRGQSAVGVGQMHWTVRCAGQSVVVSEYKRVPSSS